MICDICDQPLGDAYFRLEVAPFTGPLPSGLEVNETGQPWDVCPECGRLIKRPDWGKVLQRAISVREPFPTPEVRAQVVAALGAFYSLLRENIVDIRLVEGG